MKDDEGLPETGSTTTALDFASPHEMVAATEVGTHGAIARVEAELKGAMVLAKQFPRDEEKAFLKIKKTCERPGFAEAATYAFPRGNKTVTGPSVDLAREMFKIWGNGLAGLRILSVTDEEIHIVGYAYDAETNTRFEAEDKFAKRHQRKVDAGGGRMVTKWITIEDERDLRELINRRGAICLRNAILQVLPADLVDAALERCRETKRKGAGSGADRDEKIRKWLEWFSKKGVSIEMIDRYLGHPTKDMSADEYAELVGIAKSMQDGNTKREDHFEVTATPARKRPAPAATETKDGGGAPAAQSGVPAADPAGPPETRPPEPAVTAPSGQASPSPSTSRRPDPTDGTKGASPTPPKTPSTETSTPGSTETRETTDKEDAVAASRVQAPVLTWKGRLTNVKSTKVAFTPKTMTAIWYITGEDETEFHTLQKFVGTAAEALMNTGEKAIVDYIETIRGNEIKSLKAEPKK